MAEDFLMEYDIKNPRHVPYGKIDVTWNHPYLGAIEFTAVDPSLPGNEQEPEYMADIWAGLMRGDFGPIAPMESE